ncbi:hypothetical protein E3N88_03127 [Mikania micrantha]|uniref:Uncharacterized protein n=1 Tax=Mikania micrantha TaxID=192012 RepID=A0A5N6Q809_9ASTR|nr:hypothetical protein E3N88_03127 [Mikania micrantha]
MRYCVPKSLDRDSYISGDWFSRNECDSTKLVHRISQSTLWRHGAWDLTRFGKIFEGQPGRPQQGELPEHRNRRTVGTREAGGAAAPADVVGKTANVEAGAGGRQSVVDRLRVLFWGEFTIMNVNTNWGGGMETGKAEKKTGIKEKKTGAGFEVVTYGMKPKFPYH